MGPSNGAPLMRMADRGAFSSLLSNSSSNTFSASVSRHTMMRSWSSMRSNSGV